MGSTGGPDPLYVFREYELWLELRVFPTKDETDQLRWFRMRSFTLNLDEDVELVRSCSVDMDADQAH